MNYTAFKSLLAKSKKRMIGVGIFITLVGGPILAANFLDESKAAYWIIGGIFLALGLFMIFKPLGDLGKINSDSLPLLKAIKEEQRDFLIWMYQKQITSQVEGINAGKTSNLVIYTKNNKMEEIILGRKTSAEVVMTYLSSEFPDAHVGYADDTREAVSKILNKKV